MMIPIERRSWIENQIFTKEKVEIDEISKQLNVSSMTIRRDLTELEQEGKVIRIHGGAISPKLITTETSYSSKTTQKMKEKHSIALKAVELIRENTTILLDSGTTTFEVAKLIKGRDDLTVVTNDIKIANELIDSPLKTIVLGGEIQKGVGALYGPITEYILKEVYVDLLFLGAHAVHVEKGIKAPSIERASIKKKMIESAKQTRLLVDSSKFNKMSFSHVCQLSEIDGIITDAKVNDEIEKELENITYLTKGGE